MSVIKSSTPSFTEFDPSVIPYQDTFIDDLYTKFDYSQGIQETLLSGSVGSAKSIILAHLGCRHGMEYTGAKVMMGRESMPSLRDTLYQKMIEHLTDEHLKEGVHYKLNDRDCRIWFPFTHSEIIGKSWGDRNLEKFRSYEFSMALIEELTENKEKDIYDAIKMRVGRLPHITNNNIICATNPDSPSHWAYDYWIAPKERGEHIPTRHVYYSVTTDNPFLPKWYVEQLKKDLDPKMARRMIFGEWIEINQDVVYYAYQSDKNFRNHDYKVDETLPIKMCWDFNIGHGKPMSCVFGQYHPATDTYHWFAEVILQGSRTADIMEEAASRGLLDYNCNYEIFGDASGDHRDTRSILSDYDIIKRFLAQYKPLKGHVMRWVMKIPKANPPIRTRHNTVNGYCHNGKGLNRFFVYAGCPILHKGMRLTNLVKGGSYIEDDTPEYQHCTTAVGYCIQYEAAQRASTRAKNL